MNQDIKNDKFCWQNFLKLNLPVVTKDKIRNYI